MANKNLFKMSFRKKNEPDCLNNEGNPAYRFSPEHALAQYASTGCFNSTFYCSDSEQMEKFLLLASQVKLEFTAKTAIYCRKQGHMKDAPALLTAFLASRDPDLAVRIFPKVIDNAKMLRNFVQFVRSGVTGRKSMGTVIKRLVLEWLESRSDAQLFNASVGNNPSLADVVKMVHPKPKTKSREALYGYILGRAYEKNEIPQIVKEFEAFKTWRSDEVPNVPFEMLTALDLQPRHWVEIARNASWQMTRMNLNTFVRHQVFDANGMTELIADRLRDSAEIGKARVFPYQLLTAYLNAGSEVPIAVKEALQDAMELATANVPAIDGNLVICPDVSGSMSCTSATGYRKGSTSKVRCIDVAALIASSLLRKNPQALLIPFETKVVGVDLNPRDSVITNARKLASIDGGGTNCSAPIVMLNKKKAKVDLVVMISDNESWIDKGEKRGTKLRQAWDLLKRSNPNARLVCIDIQPYGTTQMLDRDDVINVGGFSDQVFSVVEEFREGRLGGEHCVKKINEMHIPITNENSRFLKASRGHL